MITVPDRVRLERIRENSLSVLAELIGDAQRVAIVDAPNQRNIGDSLIWQGEVEYLKRLGKDIIYVCDLRGYDARDLRSSIGPSDVILLHGGGNFGDLWRGHQRLRERVVSDFPDHKIVQLSQSIYFEDSTRAAEANRLLSSHPNFVAMIRDKLSLERAREQLPDVNCVFCPDMALGYTPPDSRIEPRGAMPEVLVIARNDRESASGLRSVPETWIPRVNFRLTDWGQVAGRSLLWKVSRLLLSADAFLKKLRRKLNISRNITNNRCVRWAIGVINTRNVDDAIRLYRSAHIVVVDRLHAHVLASLLGKPNVLLDNSYRKLGAVFDDYTGELSTATYVIGLDEARTEVISQVIH